MRALLLEPALALAIALASCLVPREVVLSIPGSLDCVQGCSFAAAGWPLPWLVDHHGISPRGSVSLIDGLLGVDHIRLPAFLLTFGFWLAITGAIGYGWRRWRSPR